VTRIRHFVRPGHGNGAGRPHVEVPPVDELPEGTPDPDPRAEAARDPTGRFVPGARTSELAARGGRSLRERTALAHSLGVTAQHPVWRQYLRQGDAFRRAQVARLARLVGGGVCGPAPASLVASAAITLAASRLAFDRGELRLGARLAAESRQHLLAAHSLAALEGRAAAEVAPAAWPWPLAAAGSPVDAPDEGDQDEGAGDLEDAAEGDVEAEGER